MKTDPGNYILPGNPRTLLTDAEGLISEIKNAYAEIFEGNRDYFPFEFRYTAPFEKSFQELKRLQGTAAASAGRLSDFKGYIVIDLSSWLTHHTEDYFFKALFFLIDMSDCWKCVFLVDNRNTKAVRELIGTILSAFFADHVPCEVREAIEKDPLDDLCKADGFPLSMKNHLRELLELGFGESVVMALLHETSRSGEQEISTDALVHSAVRYLLMPKEYDRLLMAIEKMKEDRDEEAA